MKFIKDFIKENPFILAYDTQRLFLLILEYASLDEVESSAALMHTLESVSEKFHLQDFTKRESTNNKNSRRIRSVAGALTRLFKTDKYLRVEETQFKSIHIYTTLVWQHWKAVKHNRNLRSLSQSLQFPESQYNELHQQIQDQKKLIAKLMQVITELSKGKEDELVKINHKMMRDFKPTRCNNEVNNAKQTNENNKIVKKNVDNTKNVN